MTDTDGVRLNISGNPKNLPVVRSAAERMAMMEGLSEHDTHHLVLAIDEALANVIKHGYEGRPDGPIEIVLRPVRSEDGRRGISVRVRDHGRQVDPSAICGRDLDDLRPGGLGVHIIRSVMDIVEYSCPVDGGMQLFMIKYASRPETGQSPASPA